jgi:ornithine cyclodeaminase
MLLLDQATIERLATMADCIEVIDATMREVAQGAFEQPPRQMLGPVAGTAFGIMPGATATQRIVGAKLITIRQATPVPHLASHQGVVALFDAESGLLTALLEAGSITAMRTAAASAVATRALARPDGRVLALIGSGKQAHTHLAAIRSVQPIERVVVWSRHAEHARQFAHVYRKELDVHVAATVQQAISNADVICTLTASSEPVLQGAWLQAGQHINAVGAGTAAQRELDEQAVRRARFFADFADFVRLQGGEYLAALRNGCVTEQHLLGSIGDVLDGRLAGRTSVDDITVYKSLGLIAQDIAFGTHLVRKAMQLEACRDIPFAAEHRA